MAQLVLLVVAAAWAAVLVPPMLRSRVENRPNSSVTDFRSQLNKLQTTATPPRGTIRAMGRPLTQSSLQRPAATGRSTHRHHRQVALQNGAPAEARQRSTDQGEVGQQPMWEDSPSRSPRDPSPAHDRTHRQTHVGSAQRATRVAGPSDPRGAVKRRRSNVLFMLVVTAACALFLAVVTSSTILLYAFVLAVLALCGYVYLLAQVRRKGATGGLEANWSEGR